MAHATNLGLPRVGIRHDTRGVGLVAWLTTIPLIDGTYAGSDGSARMGRNRRSGRPGNALNPIEA
jgi:hypothetical protein